MSFDAVEQIAKAVLYEGYLLYPYRASAVKNRQRWNFGGLYPRAYSEAQQGADAWTMQTECLASGHRPQVEVRVRFLHIVSREVGRLNSGPGDLHACAEPNYTVLDSLEINGRTYHTWQEAVEREVAIDPLPLANDAACAGKQDAAVVRRFGFPALHSFEFLDDADGETRAIVVRRQEPIEGAIEVSAEQLAEQLFKVRVVVRNESPFAPAGAEDRSAALPRTLASTHTILRVTGGQFVSLMDPPEEFRSFAAGCQNVGTWPVLVGEEQRPEFLLSSPIILYDFPQIAPESAGDLFDGTEVDEILTLRIQTLTDEEKQEMRDLDDRSRAILERTESLPPEQLAKMHGAIRGLRKLQEQRP